MSFELSKMIVCGLERAIIKAPYPSSKIVGFLKREFWYPVRSLKKGMDIFFRDFVKFSVLGVLSLLVATWLSTGLVVEGGKHTVDFFYISAFMAPLLVSVFSTPSSYSFCGVRSEYLKVVFDFLLSEGVSSTERLDLIKSNIEFFEKRVTVRIISLRAFMILCWSWFAYLWSEIFMSAVESRDFPPVGDMMYLSFFLIGVMLLYLAIESYSKFNILLFRSALIGCNEYGCFLISHEEGG
ncbi:hypothetical protein FZZ93_02310 [Halomonas eurihalina]|uniref:Uncharacterized protein n=1 Tax=Halomonas eurihalina TaxID=42566 RepID=A0A5D9DCR3_HALER|nr:hypothetical protein [Halomonas eurihalina]MDR5857972.1 hypothetical protein [Halomonas eurihalina]TZG41517.1 hypothetical protein FZZ93_02310 [Halomonas eurihalina]